VLEIREGIAPLGVPSGPLLAHPRQAVCTSCGSGVACGFASALSFEARGFHPTRCPVCGGRRAWFGQLSDPSDRPCDRGGEEL
jgi:hypothetical protein